MITNSNDLIKGKIYFVNTDENKKYPLMFSHLYCGYIWFFSLKDNFRRIEYATSDNKIWGTYFTELE